MHGAVIFDLDGTLLDTLEDLAASMNDALVRLGHPTHPVQAYRRFVGDGVACLAARVLPPERTTDAAEVDALVAAMAEIYRSRCRERTAPYPGIVDLLETLQQRAVRMAVLSNKPHAMTRQLVDDLLPRVRFVRVEGARNGVARKPNPSMAVDIAKSFDVSPESVWYVGDTDTDMHTATAAGMRGVGALWGFRDADELRAAGATVLVHRPIDVVALLDG